MEKFISVGLFGLGTVGQGVVELLKKNKLTIEKRVGKEIRVVKAVIKNITKKRKIGLDSSQISDDPKFILADPKIDVVVELIGGITEAEEIMFMAFKNGKSVVTANKALLAEKYLSISQKVHDSKCFLGFEASVAGSIPVLKALKDGFSGDEIEEISGIINGTDNFILSKMTEEGSSFENALENAKEKGYAEEDPSFDIEGMDTAHKLIILMNLAFNHVFSLETLHIEGITKIEQQDILYAGELGYKIKLLGKATKSSQGVFAGVHPVLIKKNKMISSVNGAYNAISILGNFAGPSMFYGQGAGAHPTASAIVADIIQVSRNIQTGDQTLNIFGSPQNKITPETILPKDQWESEFFLRFTVVDHAGVLSKIAGILGDKNISIKSVIQKNKQEEENLPVILVILTHNAIELSVAEALAKIDKLSDVKKDSKLIRIY